MPDSVGSPSPSGFAQNRPDGSGESAGHPSAAGLSDDLSPRGSGTVDSPSPANPYAAQSKPRRRRRGATPGIGAPPRAVG